MIAAELELDLPGTEIQLGKAAPMFERAADDASRNRVIAIDRKLAEMERAGYEIGTPVRVNPQTKYTFSKWHIPVAHNCAKCVLAFFIHELIEPAHEQHTRKQRGAARCR